jgi:hypothetical protein
LVSGRPGVSFDPPLHEAFVFIRPMPLTARTLQGHERGDERRADQAGEDGDHDERRGDDDAC